MLKLPKSWESDPAKGALLGRLETASRALRPGSDARVPVVPLDEGLTKALSFARRCGKMRGGLENIETLLQREETGYARLQARGHQSRPTAITRVLCVSNDGSERFYRHCESLVAKHAPRVLWLCLDLPSSALGAAFFGKDASVKALLVEQKEHVERVLRALVPPA